MNILYIGDIMGEAGIQIVQDVLPKLVDKHDIDVVIAQSENVSDGKSMKIRDMKRLQLSGVDVFSGGNHSVERKELWPLLKADDQPVIAPANMANNPGTGVHYLQHNSGLIVVVSILGTMLGKPAIETANPFMHIEGILEAIPKHAKIVVNIHAEFSSEKIVMGYHLDGRVTAVIGDHWHVPTADARILPSGTAHITDVGMCGALNGSLGAKADDILHALLHETSLHPKIEMTGPRQFCAVLIDADKSGVKAKKITQILHKE